jgi:hypothetical protein
MPTNVIIVDGSTGGTNTNVVRVIPQTSETSDLIVNAEVNKGYILSSASFQTVTLPTPCAVGDVFALHGKGLGLFKVSQRAGETIVIGSKQTTVGVLGTIESTNTGDAIYFICDDAAGHWRADSGYIGNFVIDGLSTSPTDIGYIRMIGNGFVGFPFSFTVGWQQVLPVAPSYHSVNTPNFTSPSDMILKYTGETTKNFLIDASMAVTAQADIGLSLGLNSTSIVSSRSYFNNGRQSVSRYNLSLSKDDEVSVESRFRIADIQNVYDLQLSIIG